MSKDDIQDAFDPVKEADLKGSLANEKASKAAREAEAEALKAAEEKLKESQKLAETDYALYEALNLLRGLVIAQR